MSNDERRTRYDEALRRAKGLAGIFGDFSKEVDAVMAVADFELGELAELHMAALRELAELIPDDEKVDE